ncbi:hypothetical protein CMI47_12350 [Candidatus Pacearchaeota archaeon]|nr:hypothetical protein [Candidatus Pacearchaeota archaeon]|tara:strand:- start:997 stop:1299 length:303 start_codon:yes stop_codon:yes gene_type:complete
MSRHTIIDSQLRKVVVGYDHFNGGFFMQVFDKTTDEPQPRIDMNSPTLVDLDEMMEMECGKGRREVIDSIHLALMREESGNADVQREIDWTSQIPFEEME